MNTDFVQASFVEKFHDPLNRVGLRFLANQTPGVLWYMASPYSKYPLGTAWAFQEACRASAHLIRHGLSVFCPIAHSHSIAHYGRLSPLDHDLWMAQDKAVMQHCVGMIVCGMDGWQESTGVQIEIEYFKERHKPIYFLPWKEDLCLDAKSQSGCQSTRES